MCEIEDFALSERGTLEFIGVSINIWLLWSQNPLWATTGAALQISIPIQLSRQQLVDFRAIRPVGNFPQSHVNRARHLLHLLKVDLLYFITGAVVVFVLPVKEENYGDALARVV